MKVQYPSHFGHRCHAQSAALVADLVSAGCYHCAPVTSLHHNFAMSCIMLHRMAWKGHTWKDMAWHEKIYMARDGKPYVEGQLTCSRARASSLSTLDLSRCRAFRSRWKSQLVPAIPTPLITMFSSTGFSSGASLPPAAKVHRQA